MRSLVDDLVLEHLVYERETIHLITTLYGITVPDKSGEHHLMIAKSLELMKSSTLIMDDFLDKSPLRNGMTSIYEKFGGEEATLIAEILKSSASISFTQELAKLNLKKADVVKCILLFEDTYRTVCMGQLEDLRMVKTFSEGKDIKEHDYYEMIKKTTATFIQLPLLLGAVMSNFDKSIENTLRKYGLYIGLAYQIRDDIIDITGDPSLTGKPMGGDIKEKKVRLPIIHALRFASPRQIHKIKRIYNKQNVSTRDVMAVIAILNKNGSIQYCNKKAKYYCQKAIANIQDSTISNSLKHQLEDITTLLIPE